LPGLVYSCESKCIDKSNELIRLPKISTKRLKALTVINRRIEDQYNQII
jgi:hypothetical protein